MKASKFGEKEVEIISKHSFDDPQGDGSERAEGNEKGPIVGIISYVETLFFQKLQRIIENWTNA